MNCEHVNIQLTALHPDSTANLLCQDCGQTMRIPIRIAAGTGLEPIKSYEIVEGLEPGAVFKLSTF